MSCINYHLYVSKSVGIYPSSNKDYNVVEVYYYSSTPVFNMACMPKLNEVYERYKFNRRMQKEGESFDSFLADIKTLVKTCDYGTQEDNIVRDKIVLGITDAKLQEKLLGIEKLDLEKAITACRAAEITKAQLPHVIHPYTYPPQPSSVLSLTSNMSHGSHGSSLSPQSTSSSASPPSIASINDPVGLYNGIPQQVDYTSLCFPSTYNGHNYYRYQLPIDSSAFQSRPIKMDVGPDQMGKKQHFCYYAGCKKVYGKASHLKVHFRQHTGERPFTCTWINCSKRFARSDELHRHLRLHTGEKPFTCSICAKKFMRSDNLLRHKKIHRKKTKRSPATIDESSKTMTEENPPVEEHRQISSMMDNLENLPRSTFSQELSILTNCANLVYSSPKSPLPSFYSLRHPPNQSSSLASHQYNSPSSVLNHFNHINKSTDTSNRQAIGIQNGANTENQNITATSAYNDIYTCENYPSDASQEQVCHIDNYGNSHSYL